jgi:hypothetical protein
MPYTASQEHNSIKALHYVPWQDKTRQNKMRQGENAEHLTKSVASIHSVVLCRQGDRYGDVQVHVMYTHTPAQQ